MSKSRNHFVYALCLLPWARFKPSRPEFYVLSIKIVAMPLQLKPLEPSDAKAWAWLDYISYKSTVGRYLWLRDPSPETLQLMTQDRLNDLQKPNTYHWK